VASRGCGEGRNTCWGSAWAAWQGLCHRRFWGGIDGQVFYGYAVFSHQRSGLQGFGAKGEFSGVVTDAHGAQVGVGLGFVGYEGHKDVRQGAAIEGHYCFDCSQRRLLAAAG
jgi:hypothetical protein